MQGKVIPVEVKSGAAGSMRSLHQFMDLRGATTAVRFDLNPPSRQTIQVRIPTASGQKQVEYDLISLPLGLAGQLRRLIARSARPAR